MCTIKWKPILQETVSVEFNLLKDNVVEAEDPTYICQHVSHRLKRPNQSLRRTPLSTPPEDRTGGAAAPHFGAFLGVVAFLDPPLWLSSAPLAFANALLDFSRWGISRRKGLADRAVGLKYKMPLPALCSRPFPNIAQVLSLIRKHARVPPSPRRKDPPCCPQER
jgi:hypothetical protein